MSIELEETCLLDNIEESLVTLQWTHFIMEVPRDYRDALNNSWSGYWVIVREFSPTKDHIRDTFFHKEFGSSWSRSLDDATLYTDSEEAMRDLNKLLKELTIYGY